MLKALVLLAVIAAVYSVPAPPIPSGQSIEGSGSPIESTDASTLPVAGDNKEVLEGAESANLVVSPIITGRLSAPYAPIYYPQPILYHSHPHYYRHGLWYYG